MDGAETDQIVPTQIVPILPDDLVEKIIAMIPFPYLFKARCLSKSWWARFSSVSTLEDPAEQLLATSFQKHIDKWSHTWQTLCPVCVGKDKSALYQFGYDRAAHKWERMPSLSFLPIIFLKQRNLQMEGPLLFALPIHASYNNRKGKGLYVANVLTRTWKEIPPYPDSGFSDVYCQRLVIDSVIEAYKVIRVCHPNCVHIYDSKSDAWSITEFPFSLYISSGCTSAYLNGILYMVSPWDPENLVVYDVVKGTFIVYDLDEFEGSDMIYDGTTEDSYFNLVVCSGKLLMVVTDSSHPVLMIDLVGRKLKQVAHGPPALFSEHNVFTGFNYPISDGSCIFFGVDADMEDWDIVTYELEKDEWNCFPVPSVFTVESTGKVYNTRSRAKALKLEAQRKKIVRREDHAWNAFCFQPGIVPFLEV